MKRVFQSSGEVAHLYANKVQDEARCRNASFIEDRFYSYSTLIMKRHYKGDGSVLYLIHSCDFSRTTRKQKWDLTQAIRPSRAIPVMHVDPVITDHDRNRDAMLEEIAASYGKSKRARANKPVWLAEAHRRLQEYKDYAEFFGLGWAVPEIEAVAEEIERAHIEAQQREEARLRQALIEEQDALAKWEAGGDRTRYFNACHLRIKGDNVETSQGANVPIEHAKKAWPTLLRMRKLGRTIHPENPIRLGHFQVERLDEESLVVGCHHIPWGQVEKIAGQLGLQ